MDDFEIQEMKDELLLTSQCTENKICKKALDYINYLEKKIVNLSSKTEDK